MNLDQTPAVLAARLRNGELDSPLTVRLTRENRAYLVRFAQANGITASDAVRLAIGLLPEPKPVRTRRRRTPRDTRK